MTSRTYKQPVKDKAREEIWNHAVLALTQRRSDSSVLSAQWTRPAWDFAANRLRELRVGLDDAAFQLFDDAARLSVGARSPADLKVAYLCGPEPENDLEFLVALGLEMSNVWAIEADRKASGLAIQQARARFPSLKIFPGTFEAFVEVTAERFDIVYLDLTGPFLSPQSRPYRALHAVFKHDALAPLGCLITNFTEPDFDEQHLEFLARYFWPHPWIEQGALGDEYPDESSDWVWTDGPQAHGIEGVPALAHKIGGKPTGAYGAFVTHYVPMFATEVRPWARLGRSAAARKLFLDTDETARAERWGRLWKLPQGEDEPWGGDMIFDPQQYAMSYFLAKIKDLEVARKFRSEFETEGWIEAIKVRDVVVNWLEGFDGALSDRMRASMSKVRNALLDPSGGLFANVPTPNIWAQYSAFQLGYPWHPNFSMHRRFEYVAKTRKMLVDIHVLDQARALYDHFGLLDLLGDGLKDASRQIALRAGIDSVCKHGSHVLTNVFAFGHLAPWGKTAHEENLWRRVLLE